jgi:hypothetical protein
MLRKTLVLITAGLVGLLLLVCIPWPRALAGQNDFVNLYIGSLYYGHPELCSPEANYAKQHELIGVSVAHSLFVHPAFYGFLLKPLTWPKYLQALWLFQFGSLIALLFFLKLNVRRYKYLLAICLMTPPLLANFINGQDVVYLLLFWSLSLVRIEKDWDLLAGLALSLCAVKPHVFILTPLAAIFFKRWRVLLGGAIGAVLAAISLGSGGIATQLKLFRQLRDPKNSPYPYAMPSMRSLADDHNEVFLILALLVLAATARLMWRSRSYQTAFGWAPIGPERKPSQLAIKAAAISGIAHKSVSRIVVFAPN